MDGLTLSSADRLMITPGDTLTQSVPQPSHRTTYHRVTEQRTTEYRTAEHRTT